MRTGHSAVGHPVDVVSGAVFMTRHDIGLAGKFDLIWERRYSTALLGAPTPLGQGWTTPFFASLTVADDGYVLAAPEGGTERLVDPEDTVAKGGTLRLLGAYQELSRRGGWYRLTRWDPDSGRVERYWFADLPGRVCHPAAAITDLAGSGVRLSHDHRGRLVRVQQHREQRALAIEYDGAEMISRVSVVRRDGQPGPSVQYQHDSAGQLCTVSDPLGHSEHYEYDAHSRLRRETEKDGGTYDFTYDHVGRCVRTSGSEGYDQKTLRYLPRITEVRDSLGNVSFYEYNSNNQVVREVDPLGAASVTEYDEHGRVRVMTDPSGATTSYEYDEQSNRTRWTDGLGNSCLVEFNQEHLPTRLSDASGRVWRREYDTVSRLTALVDPLGGRWGFDYDESGNLVTIADPLGATKRQRFSPDGDLVESTDWAGNVTRYAWDGLGLLTHRTDPAGGTTTYQYDALGNPLRIDFPDGSSSACAYDPAGNLTRIQKAGSDYLFRYAPYRRMVERTTPDGGVVRYRWGTEPGRLQQIVNEKGEIYEFVHDAAGRIVVERGFDGRETATRFDPAGRCIAQVNGAGEQTLYRHDALGRVVSEIRPDGSTVLTEYDRSGAVTSIASDFGTLTFDRDALGRVTREAQGRYEIQRTYDAVGNCTSIATSLGHHVAYEYDANGLVKRLTADGRHDIQLLRDQRGQEIGRLLPGVVLSQTYDALGRLTEQRVQPHTGGQRRSAPALVRRTFGYDATGILTAIGDERRGGTTYEFDPFERLLRTTREKQPAEHYAYDATGNVVESRLGGSDVVPAEYDAGGRMVRRGATRLQYDTNGRLVSRSVGAAGESTWAFSWNGRDQLTSVTTPKGAVVTYTYDPLGRRTRKQLLGKTTDYVWDGDVVIHEVEGEGSSSTWVVNPHAFTPLGKIESGQFYSVIGDHLGTPHELIDATGLIVWSARYTSWGEATEVSENGVTCPIRFPGQWCDEETGLHYNRFRYYDPQSGRFIAQDPARLLGGLNQYAYARNPVMWTDPLGLAPPCPKELKRARRAAEATIDDAQNGTIRKSPAYHGRLPPDVEAAILSKPDAVFLSEGSGRRMIFSKNGDVVITEGPGSDRGRVVTSYGPSGPQGASGAAIHGGAPTDPGQPVTQPMITGGTVPTPGGGTEPPGVKIWP